MRDSINYALREIKRRKRRSTGVIISYILVSVIVIIVSSIAGLTHDAVQYVLWDVGTHTVAYVPRLETYECCVQPYATELYDPEREGFVVNNAPSQIISEDLIEKIRQSPYVADAAPYLMFSIRSSLGLGEWLLGGIDLARPKAYKATVLDKSQVIKGRFLEPGDDNMVMLEKDFASTYNMDVGSDLQLGDKTYRVAAIVSPPLRPGKANIYLNIEGLGELLKTRFDKIMEMPVNAVLIESKGVPCHDLANKDVTRILGDSARITSYGCSQSGNLALGIHDNTLWTLSLVVIISMLLLAMRIQYSSVIQRRFEIGILKSIGWGDRNLISQIMAEAFFYAVIGGIGGAVIGYFAVVSLSSELLSGREKITDPFIIMTGLLLPLVGGLLAGAISSAKSLRMKAADILRKV